LRARSAKPSPPGETPAARAAVSRLVSGSASRVSETLDIPLPASHSSSWKPLCAARLVISLGGSLCSVDRMRTSRRGRLQDPEFRPDPLEALRPVEPGLSVPSERGDTSDKTFPSPSANRAVIVHSAASRPQPKGSRGCQKRSTQRAEKLGRETLSALNPVETPQNSVGE
jgi:hypothetical protein